MIRTDTIPVALECPTCVEPHVDEDDAAPHRSHTCLHCGHSWVPYSLPTHGVALSPRLSYHEYVLLRHHRSEISEADAWAIATRRDPMRGPRAVLVGEGPGASTWSDCPLFPWPERSSGWNLWQMSEMPLREYLRDFQRVNLLTYCPVVGDRVGAWNGAARKEAGTTARILASSALHVGWPCVLLGNRVAQSFEAASLPSWQWHRRNLQGERWVPADQQDHGLRVIRVPHPSGRNRPYNEPSQRERLSRVLQEALS